MRRAFACSEVGCGKVATLMLRFAEEIEVPPPFEKSLVKVSEAMACSGCVDAITARIESRGVKCAVLPVNAPEVEIPEDLGVARLGGAHRTIFEDDPGPPQTTVPAGNSWEAAIDELKKRAEANPAHMDVAEAVRSDTDHKITASLLERRDSHSYDVEINDWRFMLVKTISTDGPRVWSLSAALHRRLAHEDLPFLRTIVDRLGVVGGLESGHQTQTSDGTLYVAWLWSADPAQPEKAALGKSDAEVLIEHFGLAQHSGSGRSAARRLRNDTALAGKSVAAQLPFKTRESMAAKAASVDETTEWLKWFKQL